MSELKAMTVLNVQQMGCYDNALVYFKSEADKVIADKDAEIAQLQEMLEERNKQVGELKSDVADLCDDKKLTDAILDERNAEISELKEASRWRKYSEEKPEDE